MSDDEKNLIARDDIHLFFIVELSRAMRDRAVNLPPDVQSYIHTLLLRFYRSDKVKRVLQLFSRNESIALPLLRAKERDFRNNNDFYVLVSMGDFCLMLTGYWWNSLSRLSMDHEYYMSMGAASYSFAARHKLELSDVFLNLASNFKQIVSVLDEVSANLSQAKFSDQEKILMIERWLVTKNPRIREELKKYGIDPAAIPTQVTKKVM